MSEDAARKLLGVTWSDAEFFGEEALASIGKDEVNARDSRVRIEERQRFLGEDGAALAAYLALRIHALGSFVPRNYGVTSSAVGAIGYGAALLARYLGFLIVPFPPKVLAVVPVPPLLSFTALAGLATVSAVLAGFVVTAWRGSGRREIVLPLAFLFAFLLQVLCADAIGGSNFGGGRSNIGIPSSSGFSSPGGPPGSFNPGGGRPRRGGAGGGAPGNSN